MNHGKCRGKNLCNGCSHRYFCLVAVQQQNRFDKIFFKFSKLPLVEKPVFTGCHYMFGIQTTIFIVLLLHSASFLQFKREFTSSSCSCPVLSLKDFTDIHDPTLNPQPQLRQFPLHHHILKYPPLLPTHKMLFLFLMKKAKILSQMFRRIYKMRPTHLNGKDNTVTIALSSAQCWVEMSISGTFVTNVLLMDYMLS